MSRASAILGSALFFVIAPGVIAGLTPWWISKWHMQPPLPAFWPVRVLGALLIVLGLPLLIGSFARFALQGLGTPAPVAPTRHLVVTGAYRHVRNPMYVAVVALILGQGLLFGSVAVLVYGAIVWLCCHLFVLFYEEPALRKTFGAQYTAFCDNVPRWIPRLWPWRR
jgi:protein-S-isoprenylcysteine O-methyltransferase Ste14